MKRLGIVCGVKAEEASLGVLLDDAGLKVGVSGASSAKAQDLARELVEDHDCSALLSFGVSGAITDALKPGDIALARSVIMSDGTRIETSRLFSPLLAEAAAQSGIVLKHVDMADASDIVVDEAAKRALGRKTGAHAVDMESGAVAHVAAEKGVPFAALRAISDSVEHTLPHAALGAVGPGGDIRVMTTILRLVLRPQALPAMLRLAAGSSRGFKSLGRCSRDLVPALLGVV
ncbi:MAG: nucleoside phosphorylase [Candidatus Phaeomarinobacter sp.]